MATLAAAALLGAALAAHAPRAFAKDDDRGLDAPQAIAVDTQRIESFERVLSDRRDYGRLRFRGGLLLTSPSKAFGGFSDLVVEPGGRRMLAISDDGAWLTADIVMTPSGAAPTGLAATRMGPLKARSGRELKGKREKDAEGIALVSGTLARGELMISFERVHRVGRFTIGPEGVVGPSGYLPLPATVQRLKRNKSLEAVAVIDVGPLKGAIVTFAEQNREPGDRPGWLLHQGRVSTLSVRDDGDMDVTGAAGLPDGGLLLLERRFRWSEGVSMRLRHIKPEEIASGRPLVGETLLRADMSQEIDNMEGVAVHRDARGALIATLISDDNFNRILQRTLLLQFELRGIAPLPATAPAPGATTAVPSSAAPGTASSKR